MTRYLARKFVLYLTTFFLAVTINRAIPRLMPGDPVQGLIARLRADSTASQELEGYFTKSFGLDRPLWQQYLDFWRGLLHGEVAPLKERQAQVAGDVGLLVVGVGQRARRQEAHPPPVA